MITSVSAGMKFWYDDALGVLQDITSAVQNTNDFEEKNVLAQTDGFGTKMPEYTPSGRGEIPIIELSGLYKSGTGSIDALFGNRIPEDETTASRTFKVQYSTGRTVSVETQLADFKRAANKDNGITKYTVHLQPSGERTEVVP